MIDNGILFTTGLVWQANLTFHLENALRFGFTLRFRFRFRRRLGILNLHWCG